VFCAGEASSRRDVSGDRGTITTPK
jgi:hypothetical protein